MSKKTFGNSLEPVKPRGIIQDFEKSESEVNRPPNPAKARKKAGRPKQKEKMVAMSIYMTEAERKKVSESSGLVQDSTHLVAFLRENGYFK